MALDPFFSEIALYSFNFPPRGWAQCNGQLLPINQNQALFSLLGTTYGGDGRVTFALPDLRGRTPMGYGQGAGLANYDLGQSAGVETVTLVSTHMAAHTHTIDPSAITATARCRSNAGNQQTPAGTLPAADASGQLATYNSAGADVSMSTAAISVAGTISATAAGGNQAHDNRQPYLAMTFCIALQGIFPSRP